MEMVDATIAALQIETAVIHTEIKITPDGPRLIEVNGRLGGRPPFVLERVSDVNLFRVACELAVGEVPHLNGLAACSEIGFWRMLQPPMAAQRIVSIDGLDELAALDGVDFATLDRSPGELVDWRDGTDGHVVTVRGAVADYDELAAMIALIERTVEITYED
jgi:biotin carboxylase